MTKRAERLWRKTDLSAGFELRSSRYCEIPPNQKKILGTDIQIAFPVGVYGRIAPLSCTAAQCRYSVECGIIDEDYKGPINVVLYNHGDTVLCVQQGESIAQLICEKLNYFDAIEVDGELEDFDGFESSTKE